MGTSFSTTSRPCMLLSRGRTTGRTLQKPNPWLWAMAGIGSPCTHRSASRRSTYSGSPSPSLSPATVRPLPVPPAESYVITAAVADTEMFVALAFIFMLLEERNRHLAKIGESVLATLQERLAEAADVPEFRGRCRRPSSDRVETARQYSWVVRSGMASGVVLMGVAFVAAITAASKA